MKPQSVVCATPFTDQMYSAISLNWLQMRPQPESWVGEIASYLPEAHNRIVARFLEETDADRLLILEDDLAVRPNIIARARTHQADVVSGLYFARRPPYNPLVYEAINDDGACELMQPARLAELIERGGEVPITSCGTGILSIRRKVLEAIEWPWFEPSPADRQAKGFGGHDFMFCVKVRALGFSMALDTSESMYAVHVGWQHFDAHHYIADVQRQQEALLRGMQDEVPA